MSGKIILIFLLLISGAFAQQQQQVAEDFNFYYNKGFEAYQKKDYPGSVENFKKALKLNPSSIGTWYNLACAYALNGDKDQAIALLNNLLDKGQGLDAENDGDFSSIRDTKEFKVILERIKKAKTPVNSSQRAFIVKEKDLIPEGIAYDEKSGSFFLSSIYKAKIIQVRGDKGHKDFTSERQDGLWAVIGMKVDPKRNVLWANSSAGRNTKGSKASEIGHSGVFKYDIATGKLIKKYIPEDTLSHFFNDLAIADNGDIYLTDSQSPAIYKVSADKDEIELFLDMKSHIYPNGIAISADNKTLFAAHSNGVIKVDLQSRGYKEVAHPENISLNFIDGLYFYKNSLIGIQNFGFNRVARFYLNDQQDEVKDIKVIEAYNPDFIIPTTGVIAGDDLYYIANSQLASFDQQGNIFPEDKLKDVVILKAKL
ncbi:MAG: TPR end-of-group domain-containing protein [Bacillota bacterium]